MDSFNHDSTMRWDYYHHSHFTDMKTEAQKISLKSARKGEELGFTDSNRRHSPNSVWVGDLPDTQISGVQAASRAWLFLPALLNLYPCLCLSPGLQVWEVVKGGPVG